MHLFKPGELEGFAKHISSVQESGPVVVVDFTHPDAVVGNVEAYCRYGLPFVMGTTMTADSRKRIDELVAASQISAVIAPNMAAQVVALQAAMEYMAMTFPGAFAGFELAVAESHQKGKVDTSGTARAMVAYFKQLGVVPFEVSQIDKVREPPEQLVMGVREEYLDAHGFHTYKLDRPDGTMHFEFVHNIGGRAPYVAGAMKALAFLAKQVQAGVKGHVSSMIDVLKAG